MTRRPRAGRYVVYYLRVGRAAARPQALAVGRAAFLPLDRLVAPARVVAWGVATVRL